MALDRRIGQPRRLHGSRCLCQFDPWKTILFGFTWALFHHLLGGIRHIIWDTGHGFAYPQREWLAQATLIGGIVLTVGVWGIAYLVS